MDSGETIRRGPAPARPRLTAERLVGLALMALPILGWAVDHFWVQAPLVASWEASCTNTLVYLANQLAACSPP